MVRALRARTNPQRARTPTRRSRTPIVLRLGLGQEDAGRRGREASTRRTTATRKPTRDGADRVRDRRALRRQGGLGERAQGARRRDGRRSTRRRPTSRCRRTRRYARALMHLKSGRQAKGEYAQGPRASGATAAAAQAKIDDAYKTESEDERAHELGKALDAVGEAMFFAAEERKQGQGRYDRRSPSTRARAPRTTSSKYMDKSLSPGCTKKRDGDRGRRQGVPEDHRAPAGAAAALGHRRGSRAGHDVGQLRRRLPQGALPQGVGQEGLRARHGRHALLERGQGDLLRAPRRGVGAHQEREARSRRSSAASTTR